MNKDDKQQSCECVVAGCRALALPGSSTCLFHSSRALEQMGIYGKFAAKNELAELDADAYAYESQYTVEHWEKHVRNLVDAARRSGFIVRVDQVSDGPPAIGNHRDVVTVYEARK